MMFSRIFLSNLRIKNKELSSLHCLKMQILLPGKNREIIRFHYNKSKADVRCCLQQNNGQAVGGEKVHASPRHHFVQAQTLSTRCCLSG